MKILDKYPKCLWGSIQNHALIKLYNTIIFNDLGFISLNEKFKFWQIYNKANDIEILFKEINGDKWSSEDKEISYVILNEYKYLDENNFLKIETTTTTNENNK